VDEGGRVHLGSGPRPSDSILLTVLTEISASTRPRSWSHWISANARTTFRAVRDQLAEVQAIQVEPHRALGIFPTHRVRVRDLAEVMRLRADVDRAVMASGAVGQQETAMVALAAAGELGTVLAWRQRRQHRTRIAALSHSPVALALGRVVQAAKSAGSG
jgi:hypothetical protein